MFIQRSFSEGEICLKMLMSLIFVSEYLAGLGITQDVVHLKFKSSVEYFLILRKENRILIRLVVYNLQAEANFVI